MLNRIVVFTLGFGLLLGAPAGAATAQTPRDVVAAIYARQIAESKEEVPGSAFVDDAVRARYFSTSLNQLLTAADNGPGLDHGFEFDPLTSGEPGEIQKLQVKIEQSEPGKSVVSATFQTHGKSVTVTYDFVQENGTWRVDNIRGVTGSDAWSLRKTLGDAAHP